MAVHRRVVKKGKIRPGSDLKAFNKIPTKATVKKGRVKVMKRK